MIPAKESIFRIRVGLFLIFVALYIRFLFESGSVAWYIGVYDGMVLGGVLVVFVSVGELNRRP